MDTEQGIAISLAFHIIVFVALFFWKASDPRVHDNLSIEMVSLTDSLPAQKQRIKGVADPKPREQESTEKALDQQKPTPEETLGNDKIDALAIQGGSKNPQMLAVVIYGQELQAYIEKNVYYPRRAMVMGQTGSVQVRLTINRQGEFAKVEIIKPSSYPLLNQAAEELLIGLKKFKPLPSAYRGNGEFEFPINYHN